MRVARGTLLTMVGAVAGAAGAAAFAKGALPSRGGVDSDEVALVAIFDGVQLRSRSRGFRGGSLLAWYGGLEVDLSGATLAPTVHLTVHALLGGIAIRLPVGCRVESNLHALAGGVNVSQDEPESQTTSTVTLDGLAVLGGIAVGSRREAADGAVPAPT